VCCISISKSQILIMSNIKPRVLSFFSGGGGLDLGFHEAGFDILYATDFDKYCCETLEINKGSFLSKSTVIEQRDIRDINPNELPDNIDFIIGGPPCQSFSASGRRAGGAAGKQDDRGMLFISYGNIIKNKKPKGFLFENVRGILGSNKGEDWKSIQEYFLEIGYFLSFRILDACDYGIAQHRERLILVGQRVDVEFLFPMPIFGMDSLNQKSHISAKEALLKLSHDENLPDIDFVGGKYSHLLEEVPYGDNYLHFTEKRGYPNPVFAYRSRFSDFLYKANPDSPTKTLIASPGKYTGPLHWDNRYFSISEYKRLQGFPDKYIVTGKRRERIRQIGNSVSPKIAYYLARAVKNQIFDCDDSSIELMSKDFKLSFDKRKGIKARSTRIKHAEILATTIVTEKFNFSKLVNTNINTHSFLSEDLTGAYTLTVGEPKDKKFASMILELGKIPKTQDYEKKLVVDLYGKDDSCIQIMWDSVDNLISSSSNYHSLFFFFCHFTEPHPTFNISKFKSFSKDPICIFAEFISDFKNCSKFLKKDQLMELFSKKFGIHDFLELVEYLRNFRFDIRCKEINIAMESNQYMIAYPFTLPRKKQMNFSVKSA